MRWITVILVAGVLSLGQAAANAADPNAIQPSPTKAQTPAPAAQAQPTQKPTATGAPTEPMTPDTAVRIARTELERDGYKQAWQESQRSSDGIKWMVQVALTAIGLILAVFGLVIFKNSREYKEAVSDARKASEKAGEWEEKARGACGASEKRLGEIDKKVYEKLKEIETASKEQVRQTTEELNSLVKAKLDEIDVRTKKSTEQIEDNAQAERHISELWSEARVFIAEGKYEDACEKYTEIAKIKPDNHTVYNSWGYALITLAGLKVETAERDSLLTQAEEKCHKALSLKKGFGAYNLGCIWALRGDKEKCREWLLVGQEMDTLMGREYAMKDSDFDSVRNEPWFKDIKWKGEK